MFSNMIGQFIELLFFKFGIVEGWLLSFLDKKRCNNHIHKFRIVQYTMDVGAVAILRKTAVSKAIFHFIQRLYSRQDFRSTVVNLVTGTSCFSTHNGEVYLFGDFLAFHFGSDG